MFQFINDQFLKMLWLDELIRRLFIDLLGLNPEAIYTQSLIFFFYDVIKIFLLLTILIFIASYIQSWITPKRTRSILAKVNGFWANTLGALLGTVTPFCSCSSIPIFIGFTKAGLPIGVTFSFLISSPLVDLASVILLASIFNWYVAIAYVLVGLIIAIFSGSLISALKLEAYVEDFVRQKEESMIVMCDDGLTTRMSRKERIHYAQDQVTTIIHRVWPYVIIGVGIGAFIHGYIPQSFITMVLGDNNPFSVFIATAIGIPMYADIFGTLPIAEALVFKGVGLGTVLAFMMAVTALSLPSLIMLKQVIKPKLLFVFIGIVTISILCVGYLFNIIGPWLI